MVESSFSSSCGTSEKPKVVDLFDEHWFFSNTLDSRSSKRFERCNSLPTKGNHDGLDSTWKQIKNEEQGGLVSMRKMLSNSAFEGRLLQGSQQKKLPGARSLLRMPSMPSPRNLHDEFEVRNLKKEGSEGNIEKDSPKDHRIVEGPLLRAPSLPVPETEAAQGVRQYPNLRISRLQHHSSSQFSPKSARAVSSGGKARPPRDSKVDGINELAFRKAFQEKKWRSYSDLETMEVQALRDLGFVLDNVELNGENKGDDEGNGEVVRPRLSEAWFVQRSAPPVPKCVVKSSSVDMKAQIKFWARAVACNVREEC